MLFIIEWNDAAFRNRNIHKNAIITAIQAFNGCQPFQRNLSTITGSTNAAPSESIFIISDTRNNDKVQIAEDIVKYLRETFFQRNRISLGRVYEIQATRKGFFEVREDRDVF
ncbi:3658_t:CDS:2 [Funneliformis geosporum]|uniref:7268_t:CDS:1 n=1 Tax=Funneliformis geosporum TaxID=1117311 RepID=A0A9W4WLE4_9GLOM|nr:3658_t:CDS:2 [Funneliformis geosporum]CAI2170254.1 7268_t:CDS:2 [Funneliformis geosporum]